MQAPVLTSCQAFLQASVGAAPTSASFVRLANLSVSSGQLVPWLWPVGAGSATAAVDVSAFSVVRLELSQPQSAERVFTLSGGPKPLP